MIEVAHLRCCTKQCTPPSADSVKRETTWKGLLSSKAKVYLRTMWASAAFISSMAKRLPIHMRAPPPNGTNVLARGTYAVVIILSAEQPLKRQCITSYLAEAIGIKLLRLGPELGVTVKTECVDEDLGIRWDNLALELHRRIIVVK